MSSRSDSSGYMERDCLGRKCPNWSWYRKSVNSLPPDAMENVPAEDGMSSRSDSSGYMERDCLGRKCPNWSWYRKSVNSLPPDAMENVPAEDGMSSRSDSGVAWKWMTVMESSTCVFKSLRFNYITPFRPARS